MTVGAEGQGMVAGDLVNTASRLQSAAQPGTVLVGEATYRAASNAISYEPAGEQALKGKTAPVPAWRAVAVVARRGGSGRASTLEPPFVGREDELQQLKDLFDATGRERKPRLVTVIGQAGIGKSRLAWEFEKYLDGVVETAYWHEGRSPAYGEGISYWALAEMVRLRAGISEGDDAADRPAEARRRCSSSSSTTPPSGAGSSRGWPACWAWPSCPARGARSSSPRGARCSSGSPRRRRPCSSSSTCTGPTRACSTSSRTCWPGPHAPIFVVALARPELLERRPDWGSAVRSVTRINLEPLADERDGAAARGAGARPAGGCRAAASWSAPRGSRSTRSRRCACCSTPARWCREDDHYALDGDLAELAVAETLQALIAARLDANSPEDRSLIQDASVLGLSFTLEALAAVCGREVAQLGEPLDRLTRRQLLMPGQRPALAGARPVSVRAGPRARGGLPVAGQARPARAAPRRGPLLRDRWARTSWRACWPATTWPPIGTSRAGPEADAVAAQARIALQAAAERATALHSHRQAIGLPASRR